MIFNLRYKKCNKCIHHFDRSIFDCCYRPDKNGLKMLRPKRFICFKYKEQRTFIYCDCGNELITSNSFIKDTDFVYYKCSRCGKESKWDFDAPVPIRK